MMKNDDEKKLDEILNFCKENNINKFTSKKYNDDYYINIDQDVNIIKKDYTKFPIKFNIINGNFNCSYCLLETLKNSPNIINGNFICNNNFLKSLEFAPKIINGHANFTMNFIEEFNNNYTEIKGNLLLLENQFYNFETILKNVDGNISFTTRKNTGVKSHNKLNNQLQLFNINYERLIELQKKYLINKNKTNLFNK